MLNRIFLNSPIIWIAVSIAFFPVAQGQIIQFPAGSAPVIAAPSVKEIDATGRPATVRDAITGHEFVASYDRTGKLTSLESTAGRNAFDLKAISYGSDGRVRSILFGNRYQVIFRYRNDGTLQIVDSLGGVIIRSQSVAGQYVTQSVADPKGFLLPSLKRLGALFALFGQTGGLYSSVAE